MQMRKFFTANDLHYMVLPHAHAQGVRKSVCADLSVVVVTPKIASLGDLGTLEAHKLVK